MCWDKPIENLTTGFKLFFKLESFVTKSSCSTGADIEISKRKRQLFTFEEVCEKVEKT